MTCPEVFCLRFSKEKVQRLSDISYLLSEDDRRNEFRHFLLDRELLEDERTLCAWEKIDKISKSDGSIDQIKKKIGSLIKFVDEEEVNLDISHIKDLKKCEKDISEKDITNIKQQLDKIKRDIIDLLKTAHKAYIDYLSSRH